MLFCLPHAGVAGDHARIEFLLDPVDLQSLRCSSRDNLGIDRFGAADGGKDGREPVAAGRGPVCGKLLAGAQLDTGRGISSSDPGWIDADLESQIGGGADGRRQQEGEGADGSHMRSGPVRGC